MLSFTGSGLSSLFMAKKPEKSLANCKPVKFNGEGSSRIRKEKDRQGRTEKDT
jgi:hypothetical protein